MAAITSSLIFIGAGCGSSGKVAVTAGDANGETALSSGHAINLSGATPIRVDEETGKAEAVTEPPVDVPAEAHVEAQLGKCPTSMQLLSDKEITGKQARFVTSKGAFTFELLAKDSPKTVSNFVALTNCGFYNGLTFHRYVPGFVIQGGDPQGDGRGGPGYKFEDEPIKRPYATGIVAMANAGADTNGSQFFIVLEESGAAALEPKYNIFGSVTSGMDVVASLRQGDVMTKVTIEEKK